MSRGVRDDIEKFRAREKGKIGDVVGYRVFQRHARYWVETDCPSMDTLSMAVGMLDIYQQEDPAGTYAVARQNLVMISRPDKEDK